MKRTVYALITLMIFCVSFFEMSCLLFLSATEDEEKISAQTYILTEAKTGIELLGKDADKRMSPASTTKIMTAIIAIESVDLDAEFTVSKSAADVQGSQLGLLEGETLSLKDLLYFLMLKSANDAAVVIAEGVAGSIDEFALLMNEKADEIGCENSHFSNPHGLPDDYHYTTARDLARIASYAMRNETFRQIVSSKTYRSEYHSIVVANSNKLLHTQDYIKGVKTGYTKSAGRCLVTYGERDGVALIAVTMNAPDDWNDHLKLYEVGFSRVEAITEFRIYGYKCIRPVLNGEKNAQFFNAKPIYGLIIDGKKIYFEYREDIEPLIFAPVLPYRNYGYITQIYNGKEVERVPVYAIEGVKDRAFESLFEKIIHKIRNLFKNLL